VAHSLTWFERLALARLALFGDARSARAALEAARPRAERSNASITDTSSSDAAAQAAQGIVETGGSSLSEPGPDAKLKARWMSELGLGEQDLAGLAKSARFALASAPATMFQPRKTERSVSSSSIALARRPSKPTPANAASVPSLDVALAAIEARADVRLAALEGRVSQLSRRENLLGLSGLFAARDASPPAVGKDEDEEPPIGETQILAFEKLRRFAREWRDAARDASILTAADLDEETLRARFAPADFAFALGVAGPRLAHAGFHAATYKGVFDTLSAACADCSKVPSRALRDLSQDLLETALSSMGVNPAVEVSTVLSLFSFETPARAAAALLRASDFSPRALGPAAFHQAFTSALSSVSCLCSARDDILRGRSPLLLRLPSGIDEAQIIAWVDAMASAEWGLSERVDPDFAAELAVAKEFNFWVRGSAPRALAAQLEPPTAGECFRALLNEAPVTMLGLSSDGAALASRFGERLFALDEQRALAAEADSASVGARQGGEEAFTDSAARSPAPRRL
jgi:hypothetical protein